MEYFKIKNLQKLKNKYEEPYDMVKNYKSSRYDKENIYKMLDSFFTKKMIKDYNLKQLKVFKQQNNFPLIKTDKNNDIKLYKDLTNPLNLIRQISEDKEEKFIKKLEENKLNKNKLALEDKNKLALEDIKNNDNKINSLKELHTLSIILNKRFNDLDESYDLTNKQINELKSINFNKLINDSLLKNGLNEDNLIEKINNVTMNSMKPLVKDIVDNSIKNIKLVNTPGRIPLKSDLIDGILNLDNSLTKDQLKKFTIPLLQEKLNDLNEKTSEAKEYLINDILGLDTTYSNEELTNLPFNNLTEILNDLKRKKNIKEIKLDEDEYKEETGSGLFDTIKSVIKTVLPSIKTVLSKPEVQKKALELGSDYIKNKFKKKEVVPLTEQQELFKMFKNKEITAQEYKELRSLNNNEIKSEIKNIKSEDKDSNLKNLSGDYKPDKIYLDLLNKKHISPEKFLELTTNKIPNLSKPILTEKIEEPKIEPKAEGLKKKRKYIRRK